MLVIHAGLSWMNHGVGNGCMGRQRVTERNSSTDISDKTCGSQLGSVGVDVAGQVVRAQRCAIVLVLMR